MEEEGDIKFFPLDVISCILLWLPISSLLRFKSVCKSWLSLIEATDFVDKHIHISSLTEDGKHKLNLLILTHSHPLHKPQQLSLYSILDRQEVPLDFPLIGSHYQVYPVEIVASWKGIICLRQHRRICLWNPATKQCTNLPPLPVAMGHGHVGFCFEPKANAYKVVALNLSGYGGPVCHLYSSTADYWRKLESLAFLPSGIFSRMNTLYRDTIDCWLASRDCSWVVDMFDFTSEVFMSIPLPSDVHVHSLFTITENIACAVTLVKDQPLGVWSIDGNTDYEVWMLSDYQIKESWTKLYSISLDPSPEVEYIDWMTWVSDDREFLLYLRGKQLVMYDLVAQKVTKLPFHPSYDRFHVVEYRESILSIKLGNGAVDGLKSMGCSQKMLITQSMTENNDWSNSDVHKAVINRILSWLPAFSLQCFKSVCKSWHSLIHSSDFVTQHLSLHHHQHKQDNLSFILHSMHLFEESSLHSLNTSVTCLLSNGKLELLDYPICENSPIQISFNGIIYLGNSEYGECCLWNPVTKQFRDLCPDCIQSYDEPFQVGFGFDTKTNRYKLVRFFIGDDSVVQIYCLSTGSWRTIPDEVLPTIMSIESGLDAPYRNEIYCWLVVINSSSAILSFDFSNEVFKTIPLPDGINWSSLAVLRDKIVCISLGEEESYDYYSDDTDSWNCEIWMMNEYGVAESWSKLCTVGPFSKEWSFKRCYSRKSGGEDYLL